MSLVVESTADHSGVYGAPRLPVALVERPRLFGLLDESQALTVVRAPAGFGKTTLVSEWARTCRPNGVWLTIDAGCAGRLSFWQRLAILLEAAGYGVDGLSGSVDERQLRGRVIGLAASLTEACVVVIDDADRIQDQDLLDDLLALVRHGELVRLIVMGRAMAGFTDPVLGLEFHRQVVDGLALRFTHEETARALRLAGAAEVDTDAVYGVTAGVPFAVRILGLEATAADSRATLAERLDDTMVKALRRTYGRSAFARFLLRTSPAEELGVEIAAELARVSRSAAARNLTRAAADGLGTWADGGADADDARFSFVPMVRSACWSQLRREGGDVADELSRRYARWSMAHGDPYSATIAAVRGADLVLADRAVWRCFFSVSAHDSARTVAALETIPWRALQDCPALALFMATQYGATDTGRAQARRLYALAAASAVRLLRAGPTDEADRFALSVIEMVATRMIGRTDAALAAAGRVFQLYRGLSAAARQELDGILASRLMLAGHQFWQAGEISQAIDVYTEAHLVAPDEDAETYTVPLLAAGTAALGNMPLAQEWTERARRLDWPPDEKDDSLGSPYHLAEAIAALERFDLDAAEQHVRAVEQIFSIVEYWSWFVPIQAFLGAARGRPHAALVRMRAARDDLGRPAPTPQMRAVLDIVAGLLHVSAGELVLAEKAVAHLSDASAGALLVKALSALAHGAAEHAFALTLALRRETHGPRCAATGLLLHAAAAIRLGEQAVAGTSLERAATVMDLNGLRTPLSFLPPRDLRAVADFGVLPESWLTGVPQLFPDVGTHVKLTARELRLVQRLATSDGSLADFASELQVSVNTLRVQRASLYRKLGVRSRAEAVAVAEATGILPESS